MRFGRADDDEGDDMEKGEYVYMFSLMHECVYILGTCISARLVMMKKTTWINVT